MNKIYHFILWICSIFNRSEIQSIIEGLSDIINNKNPDIKPKDDFKETHPNYRSFPADPLQPITDLNSISTSNTNKNYKELLDDYLKKNNKPLKPVNHHSNSLTVPHYISCPCCNAPNSYIYFNNGSKKNQFRCKVCDNFFQLNKKYSKSNNYLFCPYCYHKLFLWKTRDDVSIFKCPNKKCPYRLNSLNNLNILEKMERLIRSSQFKISYQYRQYHFDIKQLKHSSPSTDTVNINNIHNSLDVLGLVLTFFVSCALSARKSAFILKNVFGINISYQTVLNYAETAALYCHNFNLNNKEHIDSTLAGDETYIKIKGKHNYVFFFISSIKHIITAYHIDDNRNTLPATIALNEAIKSSTPNQNLSIITDANPAYTSAIHFINDNLLTDSKLIHHKVTGLQNLDSESEKFRSFKQIIERLNRTYKHHIKPAAGFNSFNGAVALTTLFVTYYNFLRPNMSLNYKTPVYIPELQNIPNLQGKWIKILSLASL